MPSVRESPDGSRFELVEDDRVIGVTDVRIDGDVAVMPHTVIDGSRRGQGLGDLLVGAAVTELASRGLRVVPTCWFVADYLERHPDG